MSSKDLNKLKDLEKKILDIEEVLSKLFKYVYWDQMIT
jgi:hypothetical protein